MDLADILDKDEDLANEANLNQREERARLARMQESAIAATAAIRVAHEEMARTELVRQSAVGREVADREDAVAYRAWWRREGHRELLIATVAGGLMATMGSAPSVAAAHAAEVVDAILALPVPL